MPYGNEDFLGMPVYGEIAFNIPLSGLWALAWIIWWAVHFSRLRHSHSRLPRFLSFVVYAWLGIATCRAQFLVVPLWAWYLELLMTIAAAWLAPVVVGALLKPLNKETSLKLKIGIPALTLPILMGVYSFGLVVERAVPSQAALYLSAVQKAVSAYHLNTGGFPPERDWQDKLAPYAKSNGASLKPLSWAYSERWKGLQYHKPPNNASNDQIIASVVVAAGQIIPAKKISVTLDGRLIKERIR